MTIKFKDFVRSMIPDLIIAFIVGMIPGIVIQVFHTNYWVTMALGLVLLRFVFVFLKRDPNGRRMPRDPHIN